MTNEVTKTLKEKLADLEALKSHIFTASQTEHITFNEDTPLQVVDLPQTAQVLLLRLDALKQEELDLQNELLKIRYAISGLTSVLGKELVKLQEVSDDEVEVPNPAANDEVNEVKVPESTVNESVVSGGD